MVQSAERIVCTHNASSGTERIGESSIVSDDADDIVVSKVDQLLSGNG
jgi:hypothetical protein